MDDQVKINIDYAKMIGDREIQLEGLRQLLEMKEQEIKTLKEKVAELETNNNTIDTTTTPEDILSHGLVS